MIITHNIIKQPRILELRKTTSTKSNPIYTLNKGGYRLPKHNSPVNSEAESYITQTLANLCKRLKSTARTQVNCKAYKCTSKPRTSKKTLRIQHSPVPSELPHQQEAPCKVFPVQLLPKTTKKEAKVRLSDRNSWSPFFEYKMKVYIQRFSIRGKFIKARAQGKNRENFRKWQPTIV
jgi:hypothetical protein